jgi:hypothetical protein
LRASHRAVVALAGTLVATSVGRGARAEGPTSDAPVPEREPRPTRAQDLERPPLGIFPTSHDALIDPTMARSWSVAPNRPFVSTTIDMGYVYARPRVSVGYGKPFTRWVGVDGNPIATSTGLGLYGGLRGVLPYLDLRVGARQFWAFTHTYLPPQESYHRIDLETRGDGKARYLTLEAEFDAALPLGPGSVLLRGSASHVLGVPEGMSVFEETLHVIVKPPFVWRARIGYALSFGPRDQHSLGFVADLLDVPKRDDSRTIRVGPVLRFVLSRRVEVRGSFVATVVSPDRIGLVGGDFTELGVRYRWATE